jgi:hypothetical protein
MVFKTLIDERFWLQKGPEVRVKQRWWGLKALGETPEKSLSINWADLEVIQLHDHQLEINRTLAYLLRHEKPTEQIVVFQCRLQALLWIRRSDMFSQKTCAAKIRRSRRVFLRKFTPKE